MIQQTNNRILDALSCTLRGETVSWAGTLDEPAMAELFNVSSQHNILPLITDAMPTEFLQSGRPEFERYVQSTQQAILWQASKTGEICLLYRYLRSK